MSYEMAGKNLRWKYRRPQVNGHNKSSPSGNSGVNRHRGETDKVKLQAAQEQTRVNQKVLVLAAGRKRSWERAA